MHSVKAKTESKRQFFFTAGNLYGFCPMPYALCPMPYALCPMPYALCPMPCASRQ